jgi:hypothetical protein
MYIVIVGFVNSQPVAASWFSVTAVSERMESGILQRHLQVARGISSAFYHSLSGFTYLLNLVLV